MAQLAHDCASQVWHIAAQVATSQALRFGGEAERPLQTHALQRNGRSTFDAHNELQAGADAHPPCIEVGTLVRPEGCDELFLAGRTHGDEHEIGPQLLKLDGELLDRLGIGLESVGRSCCPHDLQLGVPGLEGLGGPGGNTLGGAQQEQRSALPCGALGKAPDGNGPVTVAGVVPATEVAETVTAPTTDQTATTLLATSSLTTEQPAATTSALPQPATTLPIPANLTLHNQPVAEVVVCGRPPAVDHERNVQRLRRRWLVRAMQVGLVEWRRRLMV